MKKPTHFVDWYHRFPEASVSLGAVSLVLKASEWKNTFGWMQDP